jgi:hypothetical protein
MILKQMNVGDILDTTFTMYKQSYKKYWAITALGSVPVALANFFVLLLMPASDDPMLFFDAGLVVGSLVTWMITIFFSTVMYAALIFYVSEQINGRDLEVKEAFMQGLKKFAPLFGGALLVGLGVILGTIALIIPGIYLAVLFAMYVHAIIIEGESPWNSLMRSRKLVGGNWWRSLGIFILIGVLTGIIGAIISIPAEVFSGIFYFGDIYIQGLIRTLYNIPVAIIVTPLTAIAYTLYYYDLRIRNENLDLDVMIYQITQKQHEDELR